MNNQEIQELLLKQQNQILTLQILVQCLVDELVETGVTNDESLDKRLEDKMNYIKSQMKEMRNQEYGNITNMNFGGPIGEA